LVAGVGGCSLPGENGGQDVLNCIIHTLQARLCDRNRAGGCKITGIKDQSVSVTVVFEPNSKDVRRVNLADQLLGSSDVEDNLQTREIAVEVSSLAFVHWR
jgi:hypothetical protein